MTESDEALQIFSSEAEELLKLAETSLMSLESAPGSMDDVFELYRSLHTMKGSAAMMGFSDICDYAHLLENLVDLLKKQKLTVTKNLITLLLESLDFIRSMLDNACRGLSETVPEGLKQHKEQISHYLVSDSTGLRPEATFSDPETALDKELEELNYFKISLKLRKDIFLSGRDPLPLLLSLSELGEFVRITADISNIPPFENMSIYELYISWLIVLKTASPLGDIQNVLRFVQDDNDISIENVTSLYKDSSERGSFDKKLGELLLERGNITPEVLNTALDKQEKLGEILLKDEKIGKEELKEVLTRQHESRELYRKTTVRVNVEKIDYLLNLAEEMGVGLGRMQASLKRFSRKGHGEFLEELESLIKLNGEFQDRIVRIRMFSLAGTFQKFQRMARDLAVKQNKLIKASVAGMDTELDKEVIELITDPLMHLVRNCIDHGIEPPEERTRNGKPAEGTIELRAFRKGGRVYIEISDDGRGIDWDAVQAKALYEGWIKEGEIVSENRLQDLILRPGFTTSSVVTEVSGRGVGMDVVKTHMDQLAGSVAIKTEKLKGTTFTLCLPLRFSLMEALHVGVREISYLIPLNAVLSTERLQKDKLRDLGGMGRLYLFRDEYVPVLELPQIFGATMSAPTERGTMVFVHTGNKNLGICVDEIIELRQVTVKSLETNYGSVKGIAGAAVLSDGSISLVLDLPVLDDIFYDAHVN